MKNTATAQITTIHDVAKRAGVATATVSRVLNNTAPVSDSTRKIVQTAIDELNFVPSPNARKLSWGKTFTIACIVPFFTRPSFVERLRGIVGVFEDSDYDLIVYNVESARRRAQYFNEVPRPDRCDGVIVVSMTPNDNDVNALKRFNLPVVLVDSHHPQFHSISEDSEEGAAKAVNHLIELGHNKIAFIGGPLKDTLNFEATSSARRLKGYKQALQNANIAFKDDYVCVDNNFAIGSKNGNTVKAFTLQLMRSNRPPTAIFAASDFQAMGVMQAARSMGLRVPEDLSVVGYDDIELAEHLSLTTINQSLRLSGERGATLLLETLSILSTESKKENSSLSHQSFIDDDAEKVIHEKVPVDLVLRASTAPSLDRQHPVI